MHLLGGGELHVQLRYCPIDPHIFCKLLQRGAELLSHMKQYHITELRADLLSLCCLII